MPTSSNTSSNVPDYLLPPQNIEAEMAVLGAMLMDNDAIDPVSLVITPADLYREPHRKIFQAILDVRAADDAADVVTVGEALKQSGDLEAVGGHMYLTQCVSMVTSSVNAEYHAAMIREKALLRDVAQTGESLVQEAMQGQTEATTLVSRALAILDQLAGNAVRSIIHTVKDLTDKMMGLIDTAHQTKKSESGVMSGLPCLDKLTLGFQPSRLYVIGAPTGIGKTTLLLNCLYHATMAAQRRALVFSLEMSEEELVYRLIAIHTSIPHRHIEHGQMSEHDWQRFTMRSEWMQNDRLMIVDDCNVTAEDIMAIARREHRAKGVDLVAVDYLQLLRWGGHPATDRHLQVAAQGRTMKRLARQLNIPVLAVTQLNDEGRARESRDIENDSDFFITLSESDPQHQDNATFPLAGLVRKNRAGPKGEIKLKFNKPIQRITDAETAEDF